MLENEAGGVDSLLPTFAENPYFVEDWLEAPIATVEPLSNGHYPPFGIHQSSVDGVCEWAKAAKAVTKFVDRPCYFPSKKIFDNPRIAARALGIAEAIKEKLDGKQTDLAAVGD
jgi:hypothetical protein